MTNDNVWDPDDEYIASWEAWMEKNYVDPAEKEDPVTDAEVMSGCYCDTDYQCTPCAIRKGGK